MCQKLRFHTVENESQAVNEEKRRSVSVACGASVIEIQIQAPTWVGQVSVQFTLHRVMIGCSVFWLLPEFLHVHLNTSDVFHPHKGIGHVVFIFSSHNCYGFAGLATALCRLELWEPGIPRYCWCGRSPSGCIWKERCTPPDHTKAHAGRGEWTHSTRLWWLPYSIANPFLVGASTSKEKGHWALLLWWPQWQHEWWRPWQEFQSIAKQQNWGGDESPDSYRRYRLLTLTLFNMWCCSCCPKMHHCCGGYKQNPAS